MVLCKELFLWCWHDPQFIIVWNLLFLFRNEKWFTGMFPRDLAHIHIYLGNCYDCVLLRNNVITVHIFVAVSTYLSNDCYVPIDILCVVSRFSK